MTGGSSFVPAIRKLFAENFFARPADSPGQEFTSVAQGLAIQAMELLDP
jgi:molecular chaperone DnaK (HSP70)